MRMLFSALVLLLACAPARAQFVRSAAPIEIGETLELYSAVLKETRRINVWTPYVFVDSTEALPVLYMPDGGTGEDFLHVMGLLQISILNGTMRPFLLVGIENTERRRDLTGPTTVAEDSTIAPRVGGSAAFRRFIRTELMPMIEARYNTANERAIVGESLAGLFIVETFLLEPELFDTYIAFDPSLWWNAASLLDTAADRVRAITNRNLYLAASSEPELADLARRFADILAQHAPESLTWHFEPMPEETHGTIYHPAALRAFRRVFAPAQ